MSKLPEFNVFYDPKVLGLVSLRKGKHKSLEFLMFLNEVRAAVGIDLVPKCEESRAEVNETTLFSWASKSEFEQARRDLDIWAQAGISALALGEPEYPEAIAGIYEPPLILFYRGHFDGGKWPKNFAATPMVGIVGSRKADMSGCEVAFGLGKELASAKVCVVSGLALGIDTAAHRGALEGGGRELPTIAVLGNGLNGVYPPRNHDLARSIIERGGMLISQFEPDTPPYPSNFLNRNRLIAGLSKGVIVVQATLRSGSLVTARYALEEGREVMSVPGDINNPRYAGSNKLIQQGAYLVTSAKDVAELIPEVKLKTGAPSQMESGANTNESALSDTQKKIISYLKEHQEEGIDQVIRDLGATEGVQSELVMLEMQGLIARRPGNIIALAR